MIVLELHDNETNIPDMFIMDKAWRINSDGAGHTKIWFDNDEWIIVAESKEQVKEMLHVALIGNRGVVSLADIAAVVR